MSPRSASVNEAMRRRSRERLLQATVELVEERGYEATTLADITQRAGSARGLVSYYFSGKRALLQSAVHRLMAGELAAALEREPRTEDGRELLARAIDAMLGVSTGHTTLMRTHMASILQEEGFIQCPEQQRLAQLLRETMVCWGAADPEEEYRLLRALLMGASVAMLLPGAPMPIHRLRAELFHRYGLDWDAGAPPPGSDSHDPSVGFPPRTVADRAPAGAVSDPQK
ncbi:TetR/AcrR family transcriptional regulator [Actinacidiphila bryophytorum]|uniref:Transcriptional regulator, TetR family n=1 Tax=Actinacidiphila bryophytorum TaxID=1436133 RepID=A0A9W4EDB1_9ACTN|nr:TetR/AcrR family transcriptional regulator [Actinacidiphila bryophytorum]MBM9439334.1 TetR/AcrR family transcriptional regulator [Actinacidiphila bryophytorum]MBN6545764.1 TetR/AcrR family transcriptional regulator [Actinacidiphila bryophytorum]CAG7618858.1 Transcriptional regulator, TetR family [Actinacidiphila bryophytorum]